MGGGAYIRSHEAVQHTSICHSLDAFMKQNGAALVSMLAPELMGINQLPAAIRELAIRRATHYVGKPCGIIWRPVRKFITQRKTVTF
ncbi:hypothetical protein LVQ77_19190 [Buttiauxella sp. S04-F03]|nr:phage polarity suppression protein [Buttiauxella sp. W03-F01]MCE0802403.1 hypothetical protein [Buttiauxella sp. W03-F01]